MSYFVDTNAPNRWKKLTVFCILSRFSRVRLFVTPWVVVCQAPLSMGFSRQEYGSRLLCPPPGDLPDPGIEPRSPASSASQAVSLLLSLWGSQYAAHKPINPRPVGTRWSLPITSPATNQKNVHELTTPSPSPAFTLSLQTFPCKTLRSWKAPFKHELPWTLCFVPCNKRDTFLRHGLVSVDWLYHLQASGPKFGVVTISLPTHWNS